MTHPVYAPDKYKEEFKEAIRAARERTMDRYHFSNHTGQFPVAYVAYLYKNWADSKQVTLWKNNQ